MTLSYAADAEEKPEAAGSWTPELVLARIAEGLRVAVKSTSRPGPRSYGNAMPEVFREWEDFVGREVGKGKMTIDRLNEWMEDIERVAERRFTGFEVRLAEEALSWPARFLADKPLHLDALWLTCLCHGLDANLEGILRRRRVVADRMVEARKAGATGVSGSPDLVRIYEDDAQIAAAKVVEWVNPKLAVAQSVRVKKLLIRAAKIRFSREIRATKAIERHTYVRRCDVMPGKLFNQSRVHHFRNLAAQIIADGLAASV